MIRAVYFGQWKFRSVSKEDTDRVKKDEFDAKGNDIICWGAAPKVKLASQAELKKRIAARAEKIPEYRNTLLLY